MPGDGYRTPPELARLAGVHVAKVLGWIDRGELRAINMAADPNGRPRWRISHEEWEAFLARRANGPKPAKKRKKAMARLPGWVDYYT